MREVAYERFKEELFKRRLAPGQFVSQGELCALLDTPLGPTREALKRLEAESLVRLIPQRGIQITDIGVTLIHEAFQFRTILEADPARAMSIVASGAHPNQQVVIGLVQELVEDEVTRGHLHIGWEPHTLAYAIVRIFEAFLYGDIVAGEHQDLDRAVEIIDILVRSTPTPR